MLKRGGIKTKKVISISAFVRFLLELKVLERLCLPTFRSPWPVKELHFFTFVVKIKMQVILAFAERVRFPLEDKAMFETCAAILRVGLKTE